MISVASKPPVVQTASAVADQGSQPRLQAAATETAKEPAPTFSQVSLNGPDYFLQHEDIHQIRNIINTNMNYHTA